MARAKPVLVYLMPSDRLKLEAVALLRKMSLSFTLTALVREAFTVGWGMVADPASVLEQLRPALGGERVATQRTKRRERPDRTEHPHSQVVHDGEARGGSGPCSQLTAPELERLCAYIDRHGFFGAVRKSQMPKPFVPEGAARRFIGYPISA
ncbi:MAG TPA: hypothetical protein VKZ79_22015 [Alphaproteobacteria bacterium]|nr:hypothetical protein [Alphaproteobacteria bacterium]